MASPKTAFIYIIFWIHLYTFVFKLKTQETGHAKNVANFQHLISFLRGYGAPYNPTKTLLKLPNLITLQATGHSDIGTVVTDNTALTYSKIAEKSP